MSQFKEIFSKGENFRLLLFLICTWLCVVGVGGVVVVYS